jgi:hypothetical protein
MESKICLTSEIIPLVAGSSSSFSSFVAAAAAVSVAAAATTTTSAAELTGNSTYDKARVKKMREERTPSSGH